MFNKLIATGLVLAGALTASAATANVPNLHWVRDDGNLSVWRASARICVRVVMRTPSGNTTYIDSWINAGDTISVRFGDGIASC